MADDEQSPLAEQLAAIWARFRDATLARVDQLDDAVTALLENTLSDEERAAAAREAHKLAGSSGTFGFPTASLIAREIEQRFKTGPLTQGDAPALAEHLVQLRAELEGSPRPPTPSVAPTRSTRAFLLVIDDDRAVNERLMMEASRRGFDVVQAMTVREGEQLLRARRPDAVLIDLRGAGAELLRLLESIRAITPPVPTVVVLHDGSFNNRVDIAQRGVRRCLDAPIAPGAIIDAVDAEWRQSVETRGTVLAVDDDPVILAAVEEILRARGLNLVVLDESSQFWQALEASNPDLLLLDIDMPGINGVEICRVVRGTTRWATLPIVFLTATSDPATMEAAFATGADDYLPKPIDAAQLQVRVVNRLERTRLQRQRDEIDASTGIRNRERTSSLIERFLQLARRTKETTTFALVSMDPSGREDDDMFRALAESIAASVTPDEVVGRWDGREIVVLSYGTRAAELGGRFRSTIADFSRHDFRGSDGAVRRATARVGIAECPVDGVDSDALAAAARSASFTGPDGSDAIRYVQAPGPA